jgi:hypothetical protein
VCVYVCVCVCVCFCFCVCVCVSVSLSLSACVCAWGYGMGPAATEASGSSGALYGILALLYLDLFQNWPLLVRPSPYAHSLAATPLD